MKKISKTVLVFIFGVLVAFTLDVAAETLIDSGVVSYSNSKTSETTVDGALDELFSAIDIGKQIGTTDISSIGDGTITGAIGTLNNEVMSNIQPQINNINSALTVKKCGDISIDDRGNTVVTALSGTCLTYGKLVVVQATFTVGAQPSGIFWLFNQGILPKISDVYGRNKLYYSVNEANVVAVLQDKANPSVVIDVIPPGSYTVHLEYLTD